MAQEMNQSFNILLASWDKTEISNIKTALAQNPDFRIDCVLATDGRLPPLKAGANPPDVLLLGLSKNWRKELLELAERPAASRPPVIIFARDGDPEAMRLAMKAGARDYFTRPVDTATLLSTLMQIAGDKAPAESGSCRITAFMNVKGGSGATLLATNTAHILAAKLGKRVALVDLDIQFGTLSLYLDANPSAGVIDVLQDSSELDSVTAAVCMCSARFTTKYRSPAKSRSTVCNN